MPVSSHASMFMVGSVQPRSAWRSVQPGVTINPVPSVIQRETSRGAQRVVNYLGAMGSAGLASLEGELLLCSVKHGTERAARVARRVAQAVAHAETAGPRIASLEAPGPCTYFARVGASCVVFVIVDESMTPAAVTERLGRAIAVFDRVMGASRASPHRNAGSAV